MVPLPFAKEGTLPLPKLPSITLDSPRISNLSLTQATLEVPLTLANPNVFPLPVGAVAGNLSIEGAQVGRLSTTDVGRVDARGSRTIQVPVTVRFADAYAAARALREGKAHVALDADLSSGGASVPFHVERDVDFTR